MIDCHIHIEKGDYTLDWLKRFSDNAVKKKLDEIYLLEHSYRFKEFMPMYKEIRNKGDAISLWLARKSGVYNLADYALFIEKAKALSLPVKIKFGLEVCYFNEGEALAEAVKKQAVLDFMVGSVHFIDDFAFDHKVEYWEGKNVDYVYRRYFETSLSLARCGIFNGIAHPDCIKLYGHKPSFNLDDYYTSLAFALKRNNMYAEQSGGICLRKTSGAELGMNKDMLKIFVDNKVEILTASDAHRPEDVGENIDELCLILKKAGANNY